MSDSYTVADPLPWLAATSAPDRHGPAMTTTSRLALAALAATATIAAGCGGDDHSNAKTGAAASGKQHSGPPTAPADLPGHYTTTLRRADLQTNPPPQLTDGLSKWKLTIAKPGGIDNRPALTIANAELGALESSNFFAQETTVRLPRKECAAPGGKRFYANKYRYTLSKRHAARYDDRQQLRGQGGRNDPYQPPVATISITGSPSRTPRAAELSALETASRNGSSRNVKDCHGALWHGASGGRSDRTTRVPSARSGRDCPGIASDERGSGARARGGPDS
jgi:hypothetical protein